MTRAYIPAAIGKSNRDTKDPSRNEDDQYRSLVGHSLDVVNVARELLTDVRIRQMLDHHAGKKLTPVQIERLLVLIGLHDFGKANTAFYQMIVGAQREGGHLIEAMEILDDPDIRKILGFVRRWCRNYDTAIDAIIGHHGGPLNGALFNNNHAIPTLWQPRDEYHPVREVKFLVDELRRTCPGAWDKSPKLPGGYDFWHYVAGWLQMADKVASACCPVSGPIDQYEAARRAVEAFAWAGTTLTSPGCEAALKGNPPRALQEKIRDAVLHQLGIVEGPTGYGKTEAAVMYGIRLIDAGLVTGFYFAVPTRSAATELFDRVSGIMTTLYDDLKGKCARAVSGSLGADEEDDDAAPFWPVGRAFSVGAAPVVVGTVDQAMFSVLRARHHALRRFALSRHLLIIDEVHASDPFMTVIIEHLVRNHIENGGYVLLMSATLGEEMKYRFLKRPKLDPAVAKKVAYPLLTLANADGTFTEIDVTSSQPMPSKDVHTQILPLADCYSEAVKRFKNGESILWIRSTVEDALADYDHLTSVDLPNHTNEIVLHHSRFAFADRAHLDKRVQDCIGKAATDGKTRKRLFIVATQTCEQSLDIDADFLVTDACPADVMLQRMGRLGRLRPGAREMRVIDPLFTTEADWVRYIDTQRGKASFGRSIGKPSQKWAFVYPSLVVRATLDWLRQTPTVRVPGHSREWVEAATHAESLRTVATNYGPEWAAAWKYLFDKRGNEQVAATKFLVNFARGYIEATVDLEAITRQGDSNADVPIKSLLTVHAPAQKSPTIPVPVKWLKDAKLDPANRITAEVRKTVNGRQLIHVTDTFKANFLALTYCKRGLQLA